VPINQITITGYAMYVIGAVESNHTWDSVTYFDGVSNIITVGMMQCAGSNAQNLLKVVVQDAGCRSTLSARAPRLLYEIDNAPNSWSWWSGRQLTKDEGEAVADCLSTEAGHDAQEYHWSGMASDYLNRAENLGLRWRERDVQKQTIYYMSMVHQSPDSANTVIRQAGSDATLERIHQLCLNHGILGGYTSRYNRVYDMLTRWDGVSPAPDFGQDEPYTGDGWDNNEEPIRNDPARVAGLSHIIKQGDSLFLYGKDLPDGLIFHPATINTWTAGEGGNTGEVVTPPDDGGNTGGGDNPENAAVIPWALQFLGQWSYVYGGDRYYPQNSNPPGTDCSGFVCAAFWQVRGIDMNGHTGTLYATSKMSTVYEGSGDYDALPWGDMSAGDVILVSHNDTSYGAGTQSHCGLYTGTPGYWVDLGADNGPRNQLISNYGVTVGICVRRVL
jgi:cell wall-associated NlpC family hydrolase